MAKKRIQNLLKHVVCILLCLCVVLPFYMVLINSFKTKAEAARMSLALPTEWVFSNYSEVIEKGSLIQGFLNSFAYALIATTLGVVLCSMAAFVMCRKRTKLNVFLYYFVLCGLFFPVNYVTLVRVLSTLHLNDTRVGIIMVFTSAMIPFCVFTIRNFVISVPVELDEAAVIDGANRWKQTLNVTIPGIMPTVVIMLIMRIGSLMNANQEKILLLYNPLIYETSDVIGTFVYRKGLLEADYGYSTAVGLFNSAVNVVLLFIANGVSRKYSETSLF